MQVLVRLGLTEFWLGYVFVVLMVKVPGSYAGGGSQFEA